MSKEPDHVPSPPAYAYTCQRSEVCACGGAKKLGDFVCLKCWLESDAQDKRTMNSVEQATIEFNRALRRLLTAAEDRRPLPGTEQKGLAPGG